MKKSKILISAVTMFSLCITPMSVYAQVDPKECMIAHYAHWKNNEQIIK